MIVIKLREAMTLFQEQTGIKMTYETLAERTGLSQSTIEALGSRQGYNTTLTTIDRLCDVLHCNVSDLLEHKSEQEPKTM